MNYDKIEKSALLRKRVLSIVTYALLTFCYSALAAILPALASDLFGLPHAGVNYGFLALSRCPL